MATPSSENLLLGAGVLYFDRFDESGQPTGERHLGNCSEFQLKVEVEKVEKYSSMQGAKRLYKTAVKQIKSGGKITLDEYDEANLALALLGEEGVVTQTAGSVTDELVKAFKGKWTKLTNRKVSSVVVKNNAGSTTYVVGTDYEVDAEIGRILVKENGAIVDGESLKVSYAAAAATFPKVVGATQGKIEGSLRFIGNPTTGPAYEGEFWRVSISPEGEIGFISEEFKGFSLTIQCLDDSVNHLQEPLFRLIKIR